MKQKYIIDSGVRQLKPLNLKEWVPKTEELMLVKPKFAPIREILTGQLIGQEVNVRGWVHRERKFGDKVFIMLRDGSGVVQCYIDKASVPPECFEVAKRLSMEASVFMRGTVRKDDRAQDGVEIAVGELDLIGPSENFPIRKDQSVESVEDNRHLWLRSQKLTQVMLFRDLLARELRTFFFMNDFVEFTPPLISKTSCEGGATLFPLKYFDSDAYLTQSGQLYAEAFITSYPRVFIFAPSFRMEPSRSPRHLTEFWQLEAEAAFLNQNANMELIEQMVTSVTHAMASKYPYLLKSLGRDPAVLAGISAPFERMPYEDAIIEIQRKGATVKFGEGLGKDEERILTQDRKQPIFVHNYPIELRSFYMREDQSNPGTVLDADLLAPQGHGEIVGSSERIWNYDELIGKMKQLSMELDDYQWYLDLRRYGSVPHSGFGLGMERFVKWMLNLEHIRDTTPFPRTINRASP